MAFEGRVASATLDGRALTSVAPPDCELTLQIKKIDATTPGYILSGRGTLFLVDCRADRFVCDTRLRCVQHGDSLRDFVSIWGDVLVGIGPADRPAEFARRVRNGKRTEFDVAHVTD